VRVVLNQEIK
jgi:hypothetical protein